MATGSIVFTQADNHVVSKVFAAALGEPDIVVSLVHTVFGDIDIKPIPYPEGARFDVNLGTVVLGESLTKIFKLSNKGTATLNITDISLSSGFHLSNGCSNSLAPGGSCSVTVTSGTDSGGSDLRVSGTLTIASDDPDTPKIYLGLDMSFITDSDRDGVADEEDIFSNDATKVSFQIAVGTGTDYVMGESALNFANFNLWSAADPVNVPQTNKPANMEFEHGILDFKVSGVTPGGTAQVKLTFPEPICPEEMPIGPVAGSMAVSETMFTVAFASIWLPSLSSFLLSFGLSF